MQTTLSFALYRDPAAFDRERQGVFAAAWPAGAYGASALSPRHEDGAAWFQTQLAKAHA